jgi:hypothetical protein
MLHARSVLFSAALVAALSVSVPAQAGYRGDVSEAHRHSSAYHRSDWGWARDVRWFSGFTEGFSRRVTSGREAVEGFGRDVGEGFGGGIALGRGGSAPAPLLGLTLLGQAGVAAGFSAAWRRRKSKDQSTRG